MTTLLNLDPAQVPDDGDGLVYDAASKKWLPGGGFAETGTQRIIYVSPSGNDSRPGRTMSSAKATIAAALTEMGTSPGVIVLDNGTHPVGATLAWPATAKCGMRGQGTANTTLVASSQTGPVLDLTAVGYNLNRAEFGGFTLQGDNTAGSAKKGLALSSTQAIVGAFIHDIAVNSTGGAGFDLGAAQLCHFDRLSIDTPVSAAANDIPYLKTYGAFNGNTVSRLLLRAGVVDGSATVGASGAVVMTDDGVYAPSSNTFEAPQIQGLRIPTDGTFFAIAGNTNVVSNLQAFDEGRAAGATGATSYIRFTAPSVTNLGGNSVRGFVPGRGTSGVAIDTGVDVRQSRNAITGIKGYRGYNVTIASGVATTYVHLSGSTGASTDPAVVDAGTGTVVIDNVLRTETAEYSRDGRTAANGGAGPRFYDAATVANGSVWLGQSGARVSAIGTAMYEIAASVFHRTEAGTAPPLFYMGPNAAWPGIFAGAGSPEGVVTARIGSIYLRYDGGAGTSLYVKESGTGTTGWVAK